MVLTDVPPANINSNPPAYNSSVPRPSIEIDVNDFAQTVTLGEIVKLFKMTEETFTQDATATYEIPLQKVKDTFKFRADDYVNLATNAANRNMTDLIFWCVDPSNNLSDLSFAQNSLVIEHPTATTDVAGNNLLAEQQKVPQDYYRYLAKEIFGLVQGVDLIANENDIMGDLQTLINGAWNTQIVGNILQRDQGASTTDNDTDAFSNTVVRDASQCACQYFFYQLMQEDPERFALASATEGTGLLEPIASGASVGVCSLPFVAGDKISFPLKIKAHANQKSYVDGSSIADHTYRIQLVLTEPSSGEI